MVPSALDGLTDEQLAELEAQQGQPEITTGLVDRLAASPAPTQGFTDQQLDALPTLASTPFARERGIALPPEAPAEPEPMTDYELNQLEEENYRRADYIMPQEEFRQYWTRRKEENNEVGRFIEGVGQGAAGMLAMIPEAGREIRDGMVGMVTDPVNQVQRNVQTGAEIVRKAGINMVQLFDWVGNKVDDATTWAKRRGLKHQALAKRLEQEGKLTGDELQDANIIAAAASEADAMELTPVEEEEDFDKAYDRYQREKSLEQEFAGVTDFQVGASKMTAPATSKEAYQITDEQPAETVSMIGSMALDPVNLVPLGAGALSKLRVLRRTATLAGAPLRGVQRAADATADLAERMEFGISSRVQDITGLTAKQQAALGAGAAGAAVYADAAGGGGNVTAAVTAIGSVLPGLRYGGAIIRKTGAAAGGAATIIREAGVGGIGTARAEAATDLARMTAIPERYRKYFTGYVDGTDSTLKRVSQDAGNPEALRRVARFADRAGVTTAARLADDVTSGAVAAGITGAPFAALQPDAERAGEVFGGIMALGGAGGLVGGAIGRRSTAPDADVARMMADVYAVGGNIDAFSQLPHATLDKMAAMQGVLASKVDFVPLRADEYRKNKDTSDVGGEFSAGLFLDKDANNRARIYINLDARPGQGGAAAIAPHEIGHAILTSNILDGQPRNDLRNLVNQQYGPDGIATRGREYVGRLVDGDIQNGTTGELPQVLTEQEFRDLESGNKSPSDIAKGRKLEPSERERLINERYEELSQRSIERGEDALDWARDEVIAETFASEAPAIDFRGIRRDGAFPRMAESMLAAGGRVLEMMGVRLDSGTGKMMDSPSVLFRDNPLFQDRIMQRRVKEYVRAYDQFLTGLEEAGSATPRGVELARSSRPQDMARSTHVKLRDEGRGVLENDFLFQKADGTYAYKPQKIITAAEANRAAQIKTLYDAKKFVPVNSTEFGKRKVNGREVIGGPVLPPQFDLFTQFPQHVRQFARGMEASRAEGGSWNIDYNAIGTGSSGRYRITNMGAVRAIQRETVPFGWQVTKQNHLLAASLDLNAFRASSMRAINRGELGIFNNDMKQVEADLKTYLANHRAGMPGEATIGQQKRDTLNGLIGTGTAVQRAANPLYAELNPKGSIRTWRIDRLNDAQPSGRTGYFFDYDKINNNRMPQQIPRGAQGMPDAVDALTTDQLQRQYEENQGYLGLSTLGMREGRPVRGGAAQTRELLRRNEAISAELQRRGVREEDPQLQRALQRRGQAMPDAVSADAPPFYMKSTQVLDAKIQGKAATVDQVRAILTNPQNGIKAEELKWTGALQAAERLAKENNGKVPKDALLKYLADDGAVRLEEVVFGGKQPFDEVKLKRLEAEYKALKQHPIDDPLFGEEKYDELVRLMNIRDQSTVQSLYDEASRVTLLAQQAQARGDNAMAQRYFRENEFLNVRAEKLDLENLGQSAPPRFGQYQQPGGENYRETSLVAPTAEDWFDFPRGHRYSGGPEDLKRIAHMRLNERTDTAGRPGLFLEEIQSDRHQAGRERGYQGEGPPTFTIKKSSEGAGYEAYTLSGEYISGSYRDSESATRAAAERLVNQTAIPDAPFRKDWPVQMFKRALADAVGSGKDWIGWTTGETQAARYDLSKRVDAVKLYRQKAGDGYVIHAKPVGRSSFEELATDVPAERVSDYIGKELAQKANLNDFRPGENLILEGADLKVGGEGMKGFYDQILPKEISKYVKQWGGQVEKGRIGRPKKHSGKLTRDELAEAKRDAKALINGDIDVAEFNDNWGTRLTDDDVPGNDPYRLNEAATNLVSVARKARELDAGGTFEAWRVNITPQMREGIKKAGQALFVGGAAAVVAEDQLEQ
jgi:hypothetical protein